MACGAVTRALVPGRGKDVAGGFWKTAGQRFEQRRYLPRGAMVPCLHQMHSESTPPTTRRWFPRFESREVEIHGAGEHHHEADWRLQLAASAVCLVLAIAGAYSQQPSLSTGFFVLSYLAGSWFAAGEVWEK